MSYMGSTWDMDGCTYDYPADFNRLCNETAALALFKSLGEEPPKSSFEEFTRQAQASYMDTGSPVSHFAERYSLQFDLLNHTYHELLPLDSIIPITQLPRAFERVVKSGHKVHLATHSHQVFTKRMLPYLGLSEIFKMNSNVVTLDVHGLAHTKCKSPRLIIESANNMGLDLGETGFCEDTAKNFIPIKDHDHRVKTILITFGRTPSKRPQGCDVIVRDPLEALHHLRVRPKTHIRVSALA